MLSMSLLIFGLGAAALLRAAHESFASNSSWRAAPEVAFAQRPDTTMPVLATLRVEPAVTEKANDQPAAAPADQPPAAEPARNDQVAALRPADPAPAETVKPVELPTPPQLMENPPVAESALPPAASISPEPAAPAAPAEEHKITTAAVSDTTQVMSEPVKSEPAPRVEPQAEPIIATPETTEAPAADPAESLAVTKIATLGGPPVDVADDTPAIELRKVKLPRARPDQSAIKKRVQARRALHRRRIALRARLFLQQQQVNPFGQPQPFPPPAAAPVAR
jgi:hypothetical protein